jgi:hypothetical protein
VKLVRAARLLAGHRGLTLPEFLRQQLVEIVGADRRFSRARAAALARLSSGAALGGGCLPSREALQEFDLEAQLAAR